MKQTKIASPLYILREECEHNLASVLKKLSRLGFEGIEFLGFFGHSADSVRKMLEDNHLQALGNHVSYQEILADTDDILDFHHAVGCSYLTITDLPLTAFDHVKQALNIMASKASQRDIRLLYHNHDQELIEKTEGMDNLRWIMEHTSHETLALEPDLGWIEIGGGNAAEYLQQYSTRCPVIHLKDYYTSDKSLLGRVREFIPARGGAEHGYFEFRPTGYGILYLPRLIPLCLACQPEWFVMDHDLSYERDPYDDLKLSLEYTRSLLAIHAGT